MSSSSTIPSPSRDHVGEFLLLQDSAAGREKLARLLQFAAKYLKWKEESAKTDKNRANNYVQVWSNVESSMVTVQRFLNLFKTLAVIRALNRLLPASTSDLSGALLFQLAGKVIALTSLTLDHAVFAKELGIWTPDPVTNRQLGKLCSAAWLADLINSTLEQLSLLTSLHSQGSSSSSSLVAVDATKAVSSAAAAASASLILNPADPISPAVISVATTSATRVILRNLLDIPIAVDGVGFRAFQGTLTQGHLGLLGTLSSLVGMYDMWPTLITKP